MGTGRVMAVKVQEVTVLRLEVWRAELGEGAADVATGVEARIARRAVAVGQVAGAMWEMQAMVGAAAWCLCVRHMARCEHGTSSLHTV